MRGLRFGALILVSCSALMMMGCGPQSVNDTVSHTIEDASEIPLQTTTNKPAFAFRKTDASLVPRAEYEIVGRVLSTNRYRFSELSNIASVDIVLAWGPAARKSVQEQLNISQSGRWYYWQTKGSEMPLPKHILNASMANVHMIGADKQVSEFLESAPIDKCIWLKGQLVDITLSDPQLNKLTSLSRDDEGGGACEILHVESARIVSCGESDKQ